MQKQVCPVQSQIFQYDGHVNAKKSQKYIVVYVVLETVVKKSIFTNNFYQRSNALGGRISDFLLPHFNDEIKA